MKGLAEQDRPREKLARAGAGGSLVLNLLNPWESYPALQKLHDLGWDVYAVHTWQDLVDFARRFSRRQYQEHLVPDT